jgi:hypothetical protein
MIHGWITVAEAGPRERQAYKDGTTIGYSFEAIHRRAFIHLLDQVFRP